MIEGRCSRRGRGRRGGTDAAMEATREPRYLRVNERDNVAVVVNQGGLPAGARFADGLVLAEAVPEAHKVALADLKKGEAIVRYGETIGYANRAVARGGWVHDGLMTPPEAQPLTDCPLATGSSEGAAFARGVHIRGLPQPRWLGGNEEHPGHQHDRAMRGGDGGLRGAAHQAEILPRYPHVDDVVAITHPYGCGVAIDAPGAEDS
jgi:galactarate dehydratase